MDLLGDIRREIKAQFKKKQDNEGSNNFDSFQIIVLSKSCCQ